MPDHQLGGHRRTTRTIALVDIVDDTNPHNSTPPLKPTTMPNIPWKVLVMDFKGPVGGQQGWHLHSLMDYYTRYPETDMVPTTFFEAIQDKLETLLVFHLGELYRLKRTWMRERLIP